MHNTSVTGATRQSGVKGPASANKCPLWKTEVDFEKYPAGVTSDAPTAQKRGVGGG